MKLPIHYQLILAPGFILLILVLLVWYNLNLQVQFQRQNEIVRQWTYIIDQVQIARNAAIKLRSILYDIDEGVDDVENHHFAYLQNYRILKNSISCPICLNKISKKNKNYLISKTKFLHYQDNLDTEKRLPELNELIPRLDLIYKSLVARKRDAYIEYYQSMKGAGPRIIWFSILVLLICITVGSALLGTTWRSLNSRLRRLSEYAQNVCRGNFLERSEPSKVRDDLDRLEQCIVRMTHQLIEVISVTKVVEATEEERKRIAMGMHDQTLSELSVVNRQLQDMRNTPLSDDTKCKLEAAYNNIQQLAVNLRRIIDDLHPQSLELLGLESTLQSLVRKRLQYEGAPRYYLRIDSDAVAMLGPSEVIHIFRIVSEAITNIIRHSQCSQFEIILLKQNSHVLLTVEDDGVGMLESRETNTGGHGLLNIKTRAKALQAMVKWEKSRFHQGTRLSVRIPIKA